MAVPGGMYMQSTARPDYGLQAQIERIVNNGEVPSLIRYTAMPEPRDTRPLWGYEPKKVNPMAKYCVTAECAAGLGPVMTEAQARAQRVQAADAAAFVSAWSGRVAASATVAGNAPVAGGATAVATVAALLEQVFRPNPTKAAKDAGVDLVVTMTSDRFPLLAPAFTELGELVKGFNSQPPRPSNWK